ncbi:DUF3047 domain-containing protein [Amaricoccus macauensis]|uniref:DUF3047 domain-containing protein n=1 Tax=Amaricoccus macauensis TaxID=57001 RepID=UPI003C7C8790
MKRLLTPLLAGLALAVAPAFALGPVSFGPNLDASGWQDLTFRNQVPVDYVAEGTGTLRATSKSAVSLIWKPLGSDYAAGSTASWSWQVAPGVPATDLARRGEDDRSLALYFLFADDARAAENPPDSLRAAMRRGRALIYVWGGDDARGSIIQSPWMRGRGQMIVAQPAAGPSGRWISETADLRGDFRRAFGREPGPLVGIAVSADSDDTGTTAQAWLADLVISTN